MLVHPSHCHCLSAQSKQDISFFFCGLKPLAGPLVKAGPLVTFLFPSLRFPQGAHTIGRAHCSSFSGRLYNFTGQNGASDPTLDANYTAALKGQCRPGDLATLVDLDPGSPTTFDLDYYRLVSARRGLLSTDAALLLNDTTKEYVLRQANATAYDDFFADFAESFITMGKIGVLTHQKGEIRRQCSAVNPPSTSSAAASRWHAVLFSSLAGLLLILLLRAGPLAL